MGVIIVKTSHIILMAFGILGLLVVMVYGFAPKNYIANQAKSTMDSTQDTYVEPNIESLADITNVFIALDSDRLLDTPIAMEYLDFGVGPDREGVDICIDYNNETRKHNLTVRESTISIEGYLQGFYMLSYTPDQTSADYLLSIVQDNESRYVVFTLKDDILTSYHSGPTTQEGLMELYRAFKNEHSN